MQPPKNLRQSIITYVGIMVLALLLGIIQNSFFNLKDILVVESLGAVGIAELLQYKTVSFLAIALLLIPLYALINQYCLFYTLFLPLTGVLVGSLFIEQKSVLHIQAFYLFSLIWGPLIISVLFMQLSNHLMRFKTALWFYPLLINIVGLAKLVPVPGIQEGVTSPFILIGTMILVVIVYELIYRLGLNFEEKQLLIREKLPIFSKNKVMLSKAFWLISLFLMMSLFIEQLSMSIIKSMIKSLDLSVSAYNELMVSHSYTVGASGIVMSCLMIAALPLLGWRVTAVAISLSITAAFCALLWMVSALPEGQLLAAKVQYLLPFLQIVQAMTVVLFFTLKEIAYIPFNRHVRIKGKTWIDLVFRPLAVTFTAFVMFYISAHHKGQDTLSDLITCSWVAAGVAILLGGVSILLGNEINKAQSENIC